MTFPTVCTVQYSTVLAVLCTAVLCTHALMHCISIHLPAPSPQIGLGPPKGYYCTGYHTIQRYSITTTRGKPITIYRTVPG